MSTKLYRLDSNPDTPIWRVIGTGDLAHCTPKDHVRVDGRRGVSDHGARAAALGEALLRGVHIERREGA
jgi:hypothetical protein